MSDLPRSLRRRLLLRSFLIQGSWNYRTLIGTGFAFVVIPALRHVYGNDEVELRRAVARHAELFNSHPYLATVAAGAVAKLESDGTAPELVGRFKTALRGSLGTVGDRLVWLSWRPAVAMLAIAVLLAGAPWWAGVCTFLIVYNGLHLWLRDWGVRTGLAAGLNVARAVRDMPLQQWGERARDAGALLAGVAVALAVLRPGLPLPGTLPLVGAAAVGIALGHRIRAVVWAVLFAGWLAGFLLASATGTHS